MTSKEFVDQLFSEATPPLPHAVEPGCTITHVINEQGENANLLQNYEDDVWERMMSFYPPPEYHVTRKPWPEPNGGYNLKFIIRRQPEVQEA